MEALKRILEMLAALTVIVTPAVLFSFRWISRINMTYQFSKSMAGNHLPHIYHVQKAIAKKLDIEIPEDPLIHFIETNGSGDKK